MTKEYKQYLKSLNKKELEHTLMVNKKAYGIEPPIEYKLKLLRKKIFKIKKIKLLNVSDKKWDNTQLMWKIDYTLFNRIVCSKYILFGAKNKYKISIKL